MFSVKRLKVENFHYCPVLKKWFLLANKVSGKSNRQPWWYVCSKFTYFLRGSTYRWRIHLCICILSLSCVWIRGRAHDMRHIVWYSLGGHLFDARWERASESVWLLNFCFLQRPNSNIDRDRSLPSIKLTDSMQTSVESFLRHKCEQVRAMSCVSCLACWK